MELENSNILTAYMRQLSKYDKLSKEKSEALFIDYQKGSKSAKQKIINHNLRLVVSFARRYEKSDIQKLMDLISEGNLGLIRAVEKFELSANCMFSTYASRWIQFRIEHFLSGTMYSTHCPAHIRKGIRKIHKISKDLEDECFFGNQLNEISNRLQETSYKFSKNEISKLQQMHIPSVSLEQEYLDDCVFSNIIADNLDIESDSSEEELDNWIHLKVASLPERQKIAIRSYFGEGKTDGKTYAALADEMNCTSQRAQQIVKDGLKRLKQIAENEKVL